MIACAHQHTRTRLQILAYVSDVLDVGSNVDMASFTLAVRACVCVRDGVQQLRRHHRPGLAWPDLRAGRGVAHMHACVLPPGRALLSRACASLPAGRRGQHGALPRPGCSAEDDRW
jgi:hypothetical protein